MLTPDNYSEASVRELLEAAGKGMVGLDQRWVSAILAQGEAAVPELVRFGLEDRSEDTVILDEALILLLHHFRSPEAVPFFIEYLRREREVPEQLVPAVQALGQPALEPLIDLYQELDEEDAGDVAFCLAALRIPDERVRNILVERLDYDLTEGAICLGLYGDPEAKPALERVAAQEEDAHLKGLIQDAISQLDRGPDEQEPFDATSFFEERVGPPAEVLDEPELLEMLSSSDADYRLAAAKGLKQIGSTDETVAALLEHARTDPDTGVRAKCWEALAEFSDDEETYSALVDLLQNQSAPKRERAGALIGLGQRSNEDPVRKYAEEFYEDPETRAAALESMWNSLDRSFSEYFPAHLEDSDPEIRKQAISGAGYLGIHEAAEKLRTMFDDEDLRPNALFAYALCARTEVSPARMRSLLRRIEDFAGGLDEDEKHLVELALDERLMLHGNTAIFHPDHEHDDEPPPSTESVPKVGRNDPCPCGSGKKYKKCHGA